MSILLNVTLDPDGVVACAQFYNDPGLLLATFPGITDEQAHTLAEGKATLCLDGKRLRYTVKELH